MGTLIDQYSKEQLEDIVNNSMSLKEVIRKLGYVTGSGSNNNTVQKRINKFGISTSHFSHRSPVKRTKENIFCENSTASQKVLRSWYIRMSDCSSCEICGIRNFWFGKELTMILDHKNGKHHDNRFENLRWICPNCNSQLPTFAGRNSKIHN